MAIDLVGACTLATFLAAFVWLMAIRSERTTAEISRLRQTIVSAQRTLASLRGARDHQRALLHGRRDELARTGQLPDQAPIEAYFQTLSKLTAQHHLRVLRHHPLAPRRYPGLLEQRYAYEVSGSLPDLVRFLGAVEATQVWADVSYLKVERGPGSIEPGFNAHPALLTISMFSALPLEPPSESG